MILDKIITNNKSRFISGIILGIFLSFSAFFTLVMGPDAMIAWINNPKESSKKIEIALLECPEIKERLEKSLLEINECKSNLDSLEKEKDKYKNTSIKELENEITYLRNSNSLRLKDFENKSKNLSAEIESLTENILNLVNLLQVNNIDVPIKIPEVIYFSNNTSLYGEQKNFGYGKISITAKAIHLGCKIKITSSISKNDTNDKFTIWSKKEPQHPSLDEFGDEIDEKKDKIFSQNIVLGNKEYKIQILDAPDLSINPFVNFCKISIKRISSSKK